MVAWFLRSTPISTSIMGRRWWPRVAGQVVPSPQTPVPVRAVTTLLWGSDKVSLPTIMGALPPPASRLRACRIPDSHPTIVWILGTRRIMGPSSKVTGVSWRMVTVPAVGAAIGQIHQVTAGWDIWEEVGPQMDIKHQWCLQAVNFKQPQLRVLAPLVPEVHL